MTFAYDFTPWPLQMGFVQFSKTPGVESIEYFFTVLPKAQFFWSAKDL